MRVGRDAHEGLCPLSAVDIMELLEHDLHLLPIGGVHCNKMKALHNTISACPFSPRQITSIDVP